MKIEIENITPCECATCDEYTVTFSISGNKYHAFGFTIVHKTGDVVDVDFSYIDGPVSWEDRFGKNKDRKKCLVHTGGWSYDGFGQIVAVNPVTADFGDMELEIGAFTHDQRVIGEFIYERIERLDILIK